MHGIIFLGGTLWVLLVSAGTGLARCFYERIQRNAWRRGIIVGLQMALFPMTLFLVSMAVTSAGAAELVRSASGELVLHRPDIFALAPICYGVALTLGLVLGPSFALTSPFGVWR
ncbi:MAG: hypothetical protein HC893_04340 [Chloroflexaceae bacterium]|nr:hypothetical protein [Chloroflexaceae bacterium]